MVEPAAIFAIGGNQFNFGRVLERRDNSAGVIWYASPLLESAGVPHGFSTRIGGVSAAPFDSLNLGNPIGAALQDSKENIEKNYERLAAAIGLAGLSRAWVHQVHGPGVACAEGAFASGSKADALICRERGRYVAVRVADCVPILLAGEDGNHVAAVHAGWRGVVSDVVRNTIGQLRKWTDAPLIAAIGPCISMEGFEVGGEVLEAFAARFGSAAPIRRREDGKGHVDLTRAVQLQLIEAGLAAAQIDIGDRRSDLHAGEFYSHRRDQGITGRMAALIGLRQGDPTR